MLTPGQAPLADLLTAELHASLTDPALEGMNLLNELVMRFPGAISFAAGRPFEGFFRVEDLHRHLRTYCEYLADELGQTSEQVVRTLFQYGRTKGVIHEFIARNLAVDEGIKADPESIVVTVGCQEAMYLVLRALRADERDVLLAVSPMYVGITGAAKLVDMPVLGVEDAEHLTDLQAVIDRARAGGLRPRALYLVPDFSNPSGYSLSAATRHRLLEIAEREDLLLLEDNPYGLFSLDDERPPTLKSLDTRRRVVYLGSFAKTCFPGARVGFAVADQYVWDGQAERPELFADQLSKIKSMLTVNTPAFAQALVAGKLIESDYSLNSANAGLRQVYRDNLRRLLDGLARRFPPGGPVEVTWNTPGGGFFVVLTVPFTVTDEHLERCAREHGVLWVPMHHFYDGQTPTRQIRLSCSALDAALIDEGLDRFAEFVTGAMNQAT
ncbi:PLP-dependent aminotransferase family protein [Sphaerisporangium rubeum]|uniref:(S)-3,5-dihydroxyphenylglycine transaminase n=1 Tax=Sphaerisporangium rubeum TaxID=321317 RepID=A0A7X0IKQ3_9ACTN|nr:PLP-dependent aminotransferase family protein [Sphaerisporangium rubeum]MBB6475798.1 (S)-3,5-dihydroxyphenylglycine transaminase [Sphaerisporangium rubeum]